MYYAKKIPSYTWHIYQTQDASSGLCKRAPRDGVQMCEAPGKRVCKECLSRLAILNDGRYCTACGSPFVSSSTKNSVTRYYCLDCGAHQSTIITETPCTWFRDRRIAMGYDTKQGFARAAGISEAAVGQIEAGKKRSIASATCEKLASFLGIEPDELLRRIDCKVVNFKGRNVSTHTQHHFEDCLFSDVEPILAIAGAALTMALIDADSTQDVPRAAEARFWLLYGAGADMADILGAHHLLRESAASWPPLPGTKSNSIIELARIMKLYNPREDARQVRYDARNSHVPEIKARALELLGHG